MLLVLNNRALDCWDCFGRRILTWKPKFMTDLAIWGHSRGRKTPFYRQIDTVSYAVVSMKYKVHSLLVFPFVIICWAFCSKLTMSSFNKGKFLKVLYLKILPFFAEKNVSRSLSFSAYSISQTDFMLMPLSL